MADLQTLGSALLTLGLVAIAVVLSLYESLGLEKDIGVAVGAAALATLGLLLTLRIVPPTARSLIPLGGMVIGNSMNAASLTMTRIRDDVAEQRLKVEAALGATSRQAVSPILRTALQRALIPLIDATKTTGIIFLPGAMVGMIIAGADPLEAVRLQIVVLYMLLGSISIAAILVGTLSYRSFFTPRHQLRTAPPEQ